jgi:hypothetical protein
MAETACDEQVDADAVTVKGEDTVDPLEGLLTVMPLDVVLAVVAAGLPVTVIGRATAQPAP